MKKVVDILSNILYNNFCVTGKDVKENRERGVAQLG